MANPVSIQAPIAEAPAGTVGVVALNAYSTSAHVDESDIVVVAGGLIAPAGVNPAGAIVGIATHDSNANFGGQTPPYVQATDLPYALGASDVNTPLFPADAGQTLVASVDSPVIVAINLTTVTGWISGGTYQANIGTQVGLNIDTGAGTEGTGLYVADPNASNKVAKIIGVVQGPAFGGFGPPAGTLAARVLIEFLPAALAV